MDKKTYSVAYLTMEGGRPVLKIGELVFDQNGKPLMVARGLSSGGKLCAPIPDAAIPRLQKANLTLDYIFPDGFLFPPEKELRQFSPN